MRQRRGVGKSHEQRREQIIDAALAVAARHGVDAVTQARVAAEASVSPGRVQHYFPSMTTLLTEAFDRLNAASSERIRALIGEDLDHAPPRVVLEVVLGELIPHDETTRAHLSFRQSFTVLALHHRDVASRLREQYLRLHHTDLADLIRRDQKGGRIRADRDPVTVSIGLAAFAEGLAFYVLLGAVDSDDAADQVLEAVAALYRD